MKKYDIHRILPTHFVNQFLKRCRQFVSLMGNRSCARDRTVENIAAESESVLDMP